MEKSADEKTFEQYRESLKGEAMRLACFIRVYRLLQERRGDRLAELNVAPCFFQTVEDALFSAIVLWIDKLLADGAERGLHNFLKFVENHRPLFSIERFQRRRGLPDGDWRLERAPIDYAMVAADRERIINFEPLKSSGFGATSSTRTLTSGIFSTAAGSQKKRLSSGLTSTRLWNS